MCFQFTLWVALVTGEENVQWNTYDVDHILKEVENLYKSLGTHDLPLVELLPKPVVISNYNIDFLELKTEIAHLRTEGTFLQRIITNRLEEVMSLLFKGGFTTALMKQNNHFYLFDAQSRDV